VFLKISSIGHLNKKSKKSLEKPRFLNSQARACLKKDEFFRGKSAFSLKKMLSNDPKRIIL